MLRRALFVWNVFAIAAAVPAADPLSIEERLLITEQVTRCERLSSELDEDTAYFVRSSSATMLVAIGECERALEIVNQFNPSQKRFNLTHLARSAMQCGDQHSALRLFRELDDITWLDVFQLALVAFPGVAIEPFEQCIREPLSDEQRWMIDGTVAMRCAEESNRPQVWLEIYESGRDLPCESIQAQRRMKELWHYVITFPGHEFDEPPIPLPPAHVSGPTQTAANDLFDHGLYDQAFLLASTLEPEDRGWWMTLRMDYVMHHGANDFPAPEEVQRILPDSPEYVPQFLVAAAVGNRDRQSAVTFAESCEDDGARADLLHDILQASCDAQVFVPEIRAHDSLLIQHRDDLRLRLDLVRSDALVGDDSRMQEHLDEIYEMFHSPQYVGPQDMVWVCPTIARVAMDYDVDGARELVEQCELVLREKASILTRFGNSYVAEGYLIFGDEESFRRLYNWRPESAPDYARNRTEALMGLQRWLRGFPNLRERIRIIDQLDLDDYDMQIRQWTIDDWLEDRGMLHQEPSIF